MWGRAGGGKWSTVGKLGERVDEMEEKRRRKGESAVWGGGIKQRLNAMGGGEEKTVKELHTKEKGAEGRGGWERQERGMKDLQNGEST